MSFSAKQTKNIRRGLVIAFLILQGAHGFQSHSSSSRRRHYSSDSSDAPASHFLVRRTREWSPSSRVSPPLRLTSLPLGLRLLAAQSSEGKERGNDQRIAKLAPFFCMLAMAVGTFSAKTSWAAAKVATTAAVSSPQTMPVIGLTQVGMAAVLMYYLGILNLQMQGMKPLAKSLLQGCVRCATQLYLAGSVILTPLLATSRPWVLPVWLMSTAVLAAHEASSRVAYTYPKIQRHFVLSLLFAVTGVLTMTAGFGLVAPTPWYHPRTWIPLMGMLMGNAVTATSLASKTLTHELATQTSVLEYSLCRGATWREALAQVLQSTYTTALTPTINALCVTGVVFIPGMMTGQLLAGQSAYQAANYQVLIYFLIAATVTMSVHTMTQLTLRSLVDSRGERLRICDTSGQVLLQPVKAADRKPSLLSKIRDQLVQTLEGSPRSSKRRQTSRSSANNRIGSGNRESNEASRRSDDELRLGLCDGKPIGGAQLPNVLYNEVKIPSIPRPTVVRYRNVSSPNMESNMNQNDNYGDDDIVLQVRDMKIDRTTVSISLDIGQQDIIGIKGPSGIGKSQILRTLVGLEPLDRTSVSYRGLSAAEFPMSMWRQKIALVPQDRPASLTGTPREFFERALAFESQQPDEEDDGTQSSSSSSSRTTKGLLDLSTLAHKWGLPQNSLEQPWSTLSGGEAQRMSLAIAICLKPQILLLDESTSALDESTTLVVENTLRSLNIPIIMVSHDTKQLARLSNRIIDLVPAGPFSSLRGL